MNRIKTLFSALSLRLSLGVLALLWILNLHSQPPGGPPPGGGGTTGTTPPCWEPECIPIDGGLMFFIIGGALLGGRLLYSQRKNAKA